MGSNYSKNLNNHCSPHGGIRILLMLADRVANLNLFGHVGLEWAFT